MTSVPAGPTFLSGQVSCSQAGDEMVNLAYEKNGQNKGGHYQIYVILIPECQRLKTVHFKTIFT